MTRKRNIAFAFYLLNLGISKLSSYHCSNFICCTPCIGFVFVHSWLSWGCPCYLHGTWSIATIKVAIRNGKFTYCRLQIVHESCSSYVWQGKRTMYLAPFLDGHAFLVISISRVSSIIWNFIQLIAFQWDTPSSPDPSLLVKWVWHVRLHNPGPSPVEGYEHNTFGTDSHVVVITWNNKILFTLPIR